MTRKPERPGRRFPAAGGTRPTGTKRPHDGQPASPRDRQGAAPRRADAARPTASPAGGGHAGGGHTDPGRADPGFSRTGRADPGFSHTGRSDTAPPDTHRPGRPRPEGGARAAGGTDGAAPPRASRGGLRPAGGGLWLYGTHPVSAALANPARRLRRLLLTAEAEAALEAAHPKPWPLPVERTERARLDQLLGRDVVHGGAALLADPLSIPPLATCLERPGPVLVLDQISDPRNVGAILRSAAAFGVACVIAQDRNAPEETGALAKAASGALETVPLLRAVNIARSLVALRAAGFWIVGLDAGGGPLSGGALAGRRVALVLGAEGAGLRRLTRETCDETAGLAMEGATESLNVSVAAGIALYELVRRA